MIKRNNSSWKNTQTHIKKKKKNKLALLVFAVILVSLLVGNLLRFISSLSQPLYSIFEQKPYSWNGRSNFNLVYKEGENISLIVINPLEKKVLNLNIPPNTFIEVPGGFGRWEVRSIFDLERGDSKKEAKLLKDSLSNFFGLPIDGFLQSEGGISSVDFFLILNKNPFSALSLFNKCKTDLTLIELLRLYALIFQIRSDKFESTDLLIAELLVNSKLADDTKVYFAGEKLDLFVLEKLSDPNIRNEQKTVAVLNGTDYPGLAQKISRIISNMGGNVVISDNADFKIKYTQVLGARSETLERFKQIFTSKYAKMEMQSAAWVDRFASRAQIILVLGEDMASR